MKFDIEEILLNNPLVLITPIVRTNKLVSAGNNPELWAEIASQNKL